MKAPTRSVPTSGGSARLVRVARLVRWPLLAAAALPVLSMLVAGCAGPKPIYRRSPVGLERRPPAEPGPVSRGEVEEIASGWLGTPYRYGGTGARGIDCSAFAQIVLGDLGATIPRTVADQKGVGHAIAPRQVAAGDLVFFRLDSSRVNHVGVALDGNRFAHASTSRGVVIDHMMDDYYSRRFAGARRVLSGLALGRPGTGGAPGAAGSIPMASHGSPSRAAP